ncbi:MAG: hypothetical protein RLP15_11165 [Cryomorphaceae bacterium]
MRRSVTLFLSSIFFLSILCSGCMVVDGSTAQRTKNKCCGIIKCDMHRKSARTKHKRTVSAHKSLRKKEQRIKRGW